MRALRPFALLVLLACSGSSTKTPVGPDAGAGCDSAIVGHCTFTEGYGVLRTACVEYSGATEIPATCTALGSFQPDGTYATGPCPRSQYDASCVLHGNAAPDAGACLAFATIWWSTSEYPGDAGLTGLPACLKE
jgi:hypothetical protein